MENALKSRRPGAAAAFLDARLAAGRVAFSLSELTGETGLSATAARNQLLRQGKRVARLSQMHRFFVIVSPEHFALGAPPVAWWIDDYFKWLSHPYYLALQTAASAYGANPQAIQVTQVITDTPRRPITVGRIRVQFFVKRDVKRTPTQLLTNAYAPARVSSPEATVFDLVRYAPRIGGLGRAMETFMPWLTKLRIAEMKRVLEAEDEISTAQRLGYILEQRGNPKLARVIYDWLPAGLPLIPLVTTTTKLKNPLVIEKWRLVNNAGETDL